jgi:hypothetical protein
MNTTKRRKGRKGGGGEEERKKEGRESRNNPMRLSHQCVASNGTERLAFLYFSAAEGRGRLRVVGFVTTSM